MIIRTQLGPAQKAATPYTLMVVTSDHIAFPHYSLGATNIQVGSSLSPAVELRRSISIFKCPGMQEFLLVMNINVMDGAGI